MHKRMNAYSPSKLSKKWRTYLEPLLTESQDRWSQLRPRRSFFSWGFPEDDAADDRLAPATDKKALLYKGEVVWGVISRAFFPAYLPGRHTHYGSVVYAVDNQAPYSVFEMAYRVNELRDGVTVPPEGTVHIAAMIRDDHSDFSRVRLPSVLGAKGDAYLANLCLHRSRLPLGYVHDRLVPLLIAPTETEWCCLLPLRAWSPKLQEIWGSGSPAYYPSAFASMMVAYNIEP